MNSNLPRLRHQIAWDGKNLVITDSATLVNLRRSELSASTSKSMQSCAARWAGERLLRKEKEDPFDPAPLGTSAHSVLEDFYALDGAERTMFAAEKILLAKAEIEWPINPDSSAEFRSQTAHQKARWIRDVRAAYVGIFVSETPALVNVFGRELKIDKVLIGGVPANGYIDRVETVVRNFVSGLMPADYKSGKVPDKSKLVRYGDDHGDQLRVYAEAIRMMLNVEPIGAKVIYTKFGIEREVDIGPRAMAGTLKTFADSWDRHNRYMDAASLPTKTGPLCSYCPLVNSCPVAKEAGYSASPKVAAKLPSATALGIPSLRPGITPWPLHSTRDMAVPEPGSTVTFFAPEPGTQTVSDQHSDSVRELMQTAHIVPSGETRKINEKETPVATTKDAPSKDTYIDGELNPGSPVAGALFTPTTMAVENLHTAGLPITGASVKGLAATYEHVILEAQFSWTGTRDLDDRANVRMRAALFTVVRTLPQPWGEGDEAWDAWVLAAIKRCRSITSVALYLLDGDKPESPWHTISEIAPVIDASKAKAATRRRAPKVDAPKVAPAPQSAPEPVPEPAPVPEVVQAPVPVPVPEPVQVAPEVDPNFSPYEHNPVADDFSFVP